MNQSYQFRIEQENNATLLTLSGDLTLRNATGLKADFIKALSYNEPFTVVVDNPETYDLGFIQLLVSFLFAAKKKQGVKRVDFKGSDQHLELLRNSGITLK